MAERTCLNCEKPVRARGLCVACYAHARKVIDEGKYTEGRLIELGYMAPRNSGRTAENGLAKRLERLEAAQ